MKEKIKRFKEYLKKDVVVDLTVGAVTGSIYAGLCAVGLGSLGYIYGDTKTALDAAILGAGMGGSIGGIGGFLFSRYADRKNY